MTDRTLPQLARSIERWELSDPVMMATQSPAAIRYAFEDARHDILALAPLEAENAALRARNRALELSADPDALTVAYMQGAEHANDRIRALQARVAELEAALHRLAQVAVWDEDSDRDEFDAAMRQAGAALHASSSDQSVDANKMGGADCAGGGEEG